MNVKFHDWDCVIVRGKYSNGRPSIQLFDSTTNEPIATATVNLPEVPLKEDQVIIKDYSENQGMYDCLRDAGIISPYFGKAQVGWEICPICYLIEE